MDKSEGRGYNWSVHDRVLSFMAVLNSTVREQVCMIMVITWSLLLSLGPAIVDYRTSMLWNRSCCVCSTCNEIFKPQPEVDISASICLCLTAVALRMKQFHIKDHYSNGWIKFTQCSFSSNWFCSSSDVFLVSVWARLLSTGCISAAVD